MKKTACLLLAVVQVLLCLTACSGGWPWDNTEPTEPAVHSYPSEIPTYADDKEMPMIVYCAPPATEEWFQSMVDCGFTAVDIGGNSEALLKQLALCDKVGLDAYIGVGRDANFDPLEAYGQYESFKGILTDEPGPQSQLDRIQQNRETLYSSYPNKDVEYITNFYPMLGGGAANDFQTYEEYVRYYLDNGGKDENAFMFDIYPLKVNGVLDYNWLLRLESLAPIAKEYDVDLYSFLATMSIRSQRSRRPAEDDMRYMSYVNMAYGVKGLGYFCFMSPGRPPYAGEFSPDDWALVYYEDPNDISTYYKTPTWDAVQTVNNELKALDHVFLSFDWQGVMKSHGSDATTNSGATCFLDDMNFLESYDGIKSLSSTEDTLLGLFTDENGYDGFMLVNFADTYYDKENTVTLELDGATRAVVYIKGQPQVVDLVDGTYTVTLESGEGQFIIPLS